MSTPPVPKPPPLPSFPEGVARISWETATDIIIERLMRSPLPGWLQNTADNIIPRLAASFVAFTLRTINEVGKSFGEAVKLVEKESGPALLEAAAFGLSDFFGVEITERDIGIRRTIGMREAMGNRLGGVVLKAMFGAFETGQQLTPEAGRRNAERFISYALETSLEGWYQGVLGSGVMAKWFPNWADLDDVIAQNLGIGRAMRRVIGPILTALIVTPFTRHLNEKFLPADYNEAQAARALVRGAITEQQFFETMARHGWSREKAAVIKGLNIQLTPISDIKKALRLKLFSPGDAKALLRAWGYTDEMAALQLRIIEQEEVDAVNDRFARVGHDMFRDREINDGEYGRILKAAGRSEAEITGLVGLGRIERSRPSRMPRGEMERAFEVGLVSLNRLRSYYLEEGFALEDAILLEQLALKDKLDREARERRREALPGTVGTRRVPRDVIENLFVRGMTGEGELRGFYVAAGFEPSAVEQLVTAAREREKERGERLRRGQLPSEPVEPPQATVEAAFVRGIIGEGELRSLLAQRNFSGDAIVLILDLARARRADFERRRRAEEERRIASGLRPRR